MLESISDTGETMSSNAAWRVTANTVPDADFKQYREMLIHETESIREFLDEVRGERLIISAPKGYGKTLLLIAKRLQMKEHSPEADHGGEIVDRPGGNFPELTTKLREEFGQNHFWTNVWTYCISVAAVKKHALLGRQAKDADTLEKDIASPLFNLDSWTRAILLDREHFRSPTAVFTALLAADAKVRGEALRRLPSLDVLRGYIQSQVSFYIDNIDEFCRTVLESRGAEEQKVREDDDRRNNIALLRGVNGHATSNDIWIQAQLGLVRASFNLNRASAHLKIFCTVRQEAYLKLRGDQEYHQIRAKTLKINYDRDDLLAIFAKNVQLMPKNKLFRNVGDDPQAQFLGEEAKSIKHLFVDAKESGFDFILRHTFYRPRDLMTICFAIADLDIHERSPTKIKEVVYKEAAELVWIVLGEMKPFFRLPDFGALRRFITKNVLTEEDLLQVSQQYVRALAITSGFDPEDWVEEYKHPFCVLHQIGMLGHIGPNQSFAKMDVQKFVMPDEVEVGKNLGLPGGDKYFLIHPALDALISEIVGRNYYQKFWHACIIGAELEWKRPGPSHFVVKGDICGFSDLMESEFYQHISLQLIDWVKLSCDSLEFVEVFGGDSVILIDRSFEKIIDSVKKLQTRARIYKERNVVFRFGGSAGPMKFDAVRRRVEGKWETKIVPLGLALRASARLEPHAPRGHFLVDDSFVNGSHQNTEETPFIQQSSAEVPGLPYDSEQGIFRVAKAPGDPVTETKLYCLKRD